MRLLVYLLGVTYAWAMDDEGRARKPIVVDAVGNTLPAPSNVPATVGSPVNLITPDRYEFYTFDESGELVKKLMTLEEIQAIVAAGEEAEGLVTLASDVPTMPFNITPPSYNKVHNVVTNVQNVLKAQMEAHKNNPMLQPTLDTPDVSDSWSLILPSIFGNTGIDIVPDKAPTNITPPETDTLDFKPDIDTDDSLGKEGQSNEFVSSSTTVQNSENLKQVSTTVNIPQEEEEVETTPASSTTSSTTTTTTTTTTAAPPPPTTRTTSSTTTTSLTSTIKPLATKPSYKSTTAKHQFIKITPLKENTPKPTTTVKPPAKISSVKPTPTNIKQTTTSATPTITTKKRPLSTTTNLPINTTTVKLRTTSTTLKPTTKTTPKITTARPLTTKKQSLLNTTTQKVVESNMNRIQLITNDIATEKNDIDNERNTTFIPVSTVTYITERTTQKQQPTTQKIITTFISTTPNILTTSSPALLTTESQENKHEITTFKPVTSVTNNLQSTVQNVDEEKQNTTTVTTQSISPSTTVSSTEIISIVNSPAPIPIEQHLSNDNEQPALPLFDVAQSISQIASDLGGNYIPMPTVSNILDSNKSNVLELESKESVEVDIPLDNESNISKLNVSEINNDNFVKISTLDPHDQAMSKIDNNKIDKLTTVTQSVTTGKTIESTTIDRIVSESMGDLLSQIVNPAPHPIVESEHNDNTDKKVATTTDKNIESTINDNLSSIVTTALKPTSEKASISIEEQSGNDMPIIEKRISELTTPVVIETTVVPLNIQNKLDSTEKLPSKDDNKDKNYVKISVSNEKNITLENMLDNSKIEKENISKSPEDIQNTTVKTNKEDSQVIDKFNENIKQEFWKSEITTKKAPMVEPNVIKNNDNNNVNKNISDNNNSNIQHMLPSEDLPKIDEFKKKIQKVNIDDKELANDRNNSWKLISTVSPPKSNEATNDKLKNSGLPGESNLNKDIVLDFSNENQGLEVTTKDLEEDISKFTELCNELAFRYWSTIVEAIDKRRSFVLSPYSITSMLAMMFMGARGATSGEMNDILKLDDMVTFNPHFTLKNISDSIETTPEAGVAVSAFIRELYSDKSKGKILTFYKERAQQFYNGHVEEINFKLISDIIRRRTNLLVKRYTWGKIVEYMKANTITMDPPLAAFSANIFETDCTGSSVEGRDGEMYFVVSPNVRQRRLVPVPAVVYRSGFLAGYDPVLDATAAALGNTNSIISTLFVMPGQQGNVVHAEDLEALEQRLLEANPTTPAWNRLLRTLLPRIGLELQIPRFVHKSIFNISSTLRSMGLKDLFDAEHADLGGLNGPSKDLYLSDMIQSTSFVTCGEGVIGDQHHMEEYPEAIASASRRRSTRWADWDEPRDYQRAFHDPHDVGEAMHLPLHLRPRQARLPARNAQPARLKFDRPFLYFVRHNPTGMILYVGRYNPRLLP